MTSIFKIAAFGALNPESYQSFEYWLIHYSKQSDIPVELKNAGPYPNAKAVSERGRPLRGDALKDEQLKDELLKAVADDARSLGAVDAYVMPCLSMVGFHDGVENALGKSIVKMADALAQFYEGMDRVGVIHMRPATQVIDKIFGDRAVRPCEELQNRLLEAEGKGYADIEKNMRDCIVYFQEVGIKHILLGRADAPLADQHLALDQFEGIEINSYFQVLAKHLIQAI